MSKISISSSSIEEAIESLRHLDDVKILWGTDTTAANILPEGLAALIGISGVFYFRSTGTSADDLAYCINDYLSRVQDKLKLYQYPCQEYQKIPTEAFNFKGSQILKFNEINRGKTAFSFLANSAETHTLPGHYTIQATYFEKKYAVDCIQFCFPVGFIMDQHPGYLDDMILDWSQHLNPFHGTVGLATILTTYINSASATGGSILPYLERFPGLQPDRPIIFGAFLTDGILGVNWYTMVSDELLEKVGGKQAVLAQLDENFTSWEYPGGIGIMAGQLPELGDREKGVTPSLYPKLHAILRPLYSKEIKRIIECLPRGMRTDDYDQKWLYRFDSMVK